MKKIHFSSGTNILRGWENTNLPQTDLSKPLAYGSGTVDFIFNEHVMEHLDEVDGFNFMTECYQILKPKGVLRISCPTIDGAVEVYLNWHKVSAKFKTRYKMKDRNAFINHFMFYETSWYKGKRFGLKGEVIQLNNPDLWHKFMYDKETFNGTLKKIGFKDVQFVEKHLSQYPDLRKLECRFGGGFACFPQEVDLTLEATK